MKKIIVAVISIIIFYNIAYAGKEYLTNVPKISSRRYVVYAYEVIGDDREGKLSVIACNCYGETIFTIKLRKINNVWIADGPSFKAKDI